MTPYKDYDLYKWLFKEMYDFYKCDKERFKNIFHFNEGELING